MFAGIRTKNPFSGNGIKEKNGFPFKAFRLTCVGLIFSPLLLFSQGNTLSFDYFSQENGLSNNQVHAIHQDSRGFMWFGTSQGISRFDGYRFTRFVNNPSDTNTLTGNLVRVIFEDSRGRLFAGTENGGVNLYDRDREFFLPLFGKESGFQEASVNDIKEDKQGILWIGTDNGLLLYRENGRITRVVPEESSSGKRFSGNFIRIMTFDAAGKLWMGTNNGLFVLDTAANRVSPFPLPVPESLNEEIWELVIGDDGRIWTGTYDNGIFIIGTDNHIAQHLIPDPANNRSRTVRAIARDPKGDFWIGTRGGLFIYDQVQGIVASYYHDERESRSLSGNSVLEIFHDKRGDTWIGTRTGINYLVHTKQLFRNFRAMPNDKHYLNSNEIWAFHADKEGKIWIGTEDGGVNIYDPASHSFDYLVSRPGDPNSLSSNCIKSFLDDGKGHLWIATFRGGINILDRRNGRIVHIRNIPGDDTSLSDDRVWCLFSDSKKRIWVGSSLGIDQYDPASGKFIRLRKPGMEAQVNWIREDHQGFLWIGARDELLVYHPDNDSLFRFNEKTRDFFQDSQNRIWIATLTSGLAEYSRGKGAIRYFTEEDGIANNQALSILEDNNRFLWIGTSNGLSRFNPETGYFRTFSGKDGLQNSQFNYGAALKLPSGELLFGGISGFNLFDPLKAGGSETGAPMVLTELRIFNKRVEIGTGRKPVLKRSITETGEITLPFNQKVITIEFAALNYVNSQNNLYSYFLEGFDKTWTDPSVNRAATYTNLNPGEYVFRVKSVIPGIPDAGNEISLKINIYPPFWKTSLFKIITFSLILSLIYALVRFVMNREKLKNDLHFERIKARKLHELDMLKLRFFTNISHEIRTPLTLILGPLEKIRNNQVPGEQMKPLLEIIVRNARHLNQLINQILDFRKLETGNLKPELADGELTGFVQGIAAQFDHLAQEKEIRYGFSAMSDKIICRFDGDKLEKIVTNLLSNAFKFTEKGGSITVSLAVIYDRSEMKPDDDESGTRYIEIRVKDTGKGIPASQLDKIFIRFFQSEEKNDHQGTGIGLALVHELVKLLDGKVFVTSKPGEGSRFTVRLPFLEPEGEIPGDRCDDERSVVTPGTSGQGDYDAYTREKIMLVVEDNADVRLFIRNHFETSFQILEAADGYEGWELALKTVPDIILCDILMPRVDGYELLKRLKNDERTSHIPVILLTALVSKDNELEGLAGGADDYITKPFDLAILETKIENILSIRKSLQKRYSAEIVLQPQNILISPHDERFLKKVMEIVENNIGDPDLDIERFAAEASVSRMQLYRKLSALTDMTVKEFIRDIRLKRAAQLLLQRNMNVSEIAWATGFRDVSHFRKCFRRKFGMSATEYANGI